MTRRCLDEHGVAVKLGRTREWFARHKQRLVSELGFPERLPIVRRWDEAAIDAWLERQRRRHDQGQPEGAVIIGTPAAPMDWEQVLLERADALTAD